MTQPEPPLGETRATPPGQPAAPVDAPAVPPSPYEPPPSPPHQPRRTALIIGLAVAALVLPVGASVATYYLTRHEPPPPPSDPATLAIHACEEAVKDRLKAPATARFLHESARQSGTLYYVEGDVDAENGFGALIRGHFRCTSTGSGSDPSGWSGYDVELTS